MKLNLAGVDSNGLKAMDAGTYDATCVEVKQTNAKSSGNPMVVLKFRVTEEPYIGRNVFLNVVLLPQTMWKVKATFEALLGEELPSEDGVDIEPEDLVGKPCRVKIEQREYEGIMRESVQSVLAFGGTSNTAAKKPSLFS